MDVCDEVMTKIDKPTGLIRLSSHTGIETGQSKIFTPRIVGYTVVLSALVIFLSFLLLSRTDIEITVLKVPGTLYQKTDDGQISNLYNLQFINKTFEDITLELKLVDVENSTLEQVGNQGIMIPANGMFDAIFFIKRPQSEITTSKSKIEIAVYQEGQLIEKISTKFLGPVTFKK
jgi:polyferredoxin